ncbi:hypothetical protein COOONC_21372 [Cooperia oncophora]
MSDQEWDLLINAPHKGNDGKTLPVKLETIEKLASDQLQNIASIRTVIHDLYRNFLTEELENETVFEKEYRAAAIERLQANPRAAVIDTRKKFSIRCCCSSEHSSRAESPGGLEHRELRIVKENSEFAEGIKEEEDAQMDPEEEEEVPPPELAEDEESGEEDDGDRQGSPPAQEERQEDVADNNVQLGAEPEEEEPEAVEPPEVRLARMRMKKKKNQ